MLKCTVFAMAALMAGVTAVAAQDVIAQRIDLMKRSGDQATIGARMIKGEVPYDQAKAQAIFDAFIDKAQKMRTLFPENSKTGKTSALPAIWEKPAEWNAEISKFEAGSKAAKAASKDLATFRAAFERVDENCSSCHRQFRRRQ